MSKGWAFVGNYLKSTSGSVGSIQTKLNTTTLHGDEKFTYDHASSEVYLSGNLNVSGTINANALNVDVTNKTVTNIEQFGSTKFGDSIDDTHLFTGSFVITGASTSNITEDSGGVVTVTDPTFVVSGSSVFNNIQVKGSIFGSSPVPIPGGVNVGSIQSHVGILSITGGIHITGSDPSDGMLIKMGSLTLVNNLTGAVFSDIGPDLILRSETDSALHRPAISLVNNRASYTSNAYCGRVAWKATSQGGVANTLYAYMDTFAKTDSGAINDRGNIAIHYRNPQMLVTYPKIFEMGGYGAMAASQIKVYAHLTPWEGYSKATTDHNLGTATRPWGNFYIGDDKYTYFGADQDIKMGFVSATNDLEVSGATRFVNGVKMTGLSPGVGASETSYLAVDASNNLVLTAAVGGGGSGGQIGASEDGDYTDGLFTDFTTGTAVGTAVDRFNEVLKILAPSPAPAVDRINYSNAAGIAAKLSFGASKVVTDYTSSGTAAGFSAVDATEVYQSQTSGENERLGIYRKNQTITGEVNFHITDSITNGNYAYRQDSFGNGDTGILKLELNGVVVHSIDLSSFSGAGNSPNGTDDTGVNGNGSGFVNVSIANSTLDGNGANWGAIFKYRSADYSIDPTDQKVGWNYLKVTHTVGATNYTTNFVEWINDPSGSVNDLSATNGRIEDVSLIGSKYLSGVEYNTNATANYKVDLNNLYRNVYASSGNPISFTVSNSSTPSAQSVPDLGGGEDHTKTLAITGALNVGGAVNNLLNGTLSANVSATHPFKNTLSNAGAASQTGFLIDNRNLNSTNVLERFHDEGYRKTNGSYNTQADIDAGGSIWNSQNHMTGGGAAGHDDGLLLYNQRLYSPIDADIPNNGNFSTIGNSPAGNPNYSGVTGTRTYFRVLTNSSGVTKRDIKITSTKNGTKYSNATLDTDDIQFYVKIPGKTGWMDISQNFTYGNTSDDDGALINGANDNNNITGTGNSVHCLTFGTLGVDNGEKLMLKIQADESWQGYLSQLNFQLGASDVGIPTQAPVLDDVDADVSGISARLSIGASNTVAGISNATGSSISLSDFDSNDHYNQSGDRRGIFTSKQELTGTLNEDVGSNGSNYPANSFRNGYTGSLVVEVNGVEKHNIDLSSTLSAINSKNGTDDGFSVSAISYSTTSDGIPDYTKPYRTGNYFVGPNSQNIGWNYARVIHRIGGSDTQTNYVEWYVDTDSSALSATGTTLTNFATDGVYYQSGVKYWTTTPSASYSYLAANAYRNVYQYGTAISYSSLTNTSVSNIRIVGNGVVTRDVAAASSILASLNNTANCHQQDIEVTGTISFTPSTSLVGHSSYVGGQVHTASARSTLKHPIKSNLTTNTLSKSGFLVFSASLGSTNQNTEEYFNLESYRRKAAAHNTQNDATGSANNWDSSADMTTAAGHDDGLLVFNGYLVSPLKGGVDGDFRNVADGGTIQSPAGNVNYSTGQLSNNERTFYRYYRNNTVNDRSSITITLYGVGSLVNKQTALGANGNFHMEVKVPGNTAWLDGGKAYTANNKDSDGSGALVGGSSPTSINTGGASVSNTFNGGSLNGTVSAAASGGEVVMIKITAHKDWTGYLSRLKVAYS